MAIKNYNKPKLLDFLFGTSEEITNNETDAFKNQPKKNSTNRLLTPEDLEIKKFAILSKSNNDQKVEQDFRETRALYKNQKSASNPELTKAYKAYAKAYYKLSSVYTLYDNRYNIEGATLVVFDTEKRKEKSYIIPSKTGSAAITLLPNGELFCFRNEDYSGKAWIIDKDYEAMRSVPSVLFCCNWKPAYFNKNLYCFGRCQNEKKEFYYYRAISYRFDLDQNRWAELATIPINDYEGQSVIINRNILISGNHSSDIWLYSIDTDTFSKISYKFVDYAWKLFIKAEKVYLIEFNIASGFIYESEDNCGYAWRKISKSILGNVLQPFCSYNKETLYFMSFYVINSEVAYKIYYYEFNLANLEWKWKKQICKRVEWLKDRFLSKANYNL